MQQVQHETKDTKSESNPVSPITAGLTGVLIGAAGAAAIALSDEETRKKATKKAKQIKDDLQKWSTKTINDMQHRVAESEPRNGRGEQMKAKSKPTLDTPKTEVSREVKERLDENEPLK